MDTRKTLGFATSVNRSAIVQTMGKEMKLYNKEEMNAMPIFLRKTAEPKNLFYGFINRLKSGEN